MCEFILSMDCSNVFWVVLRPSNALESQTLIQMKKKLNILRRLHEITTYFNAKHFDAFFFRKQPLPICLHDTCNDFSMIILIVQSSLIVAYQIFCFHLDSGAFCFINCCYCYYYYLLLLLLLLILFPKRIRFC